MSNYYNLELEKIQKLVLNKKYGKIFVQMPEGMLNTPLKAVLEVLDPLGVQVIVSGDPSYGVCDIAIETATKLGCDLLIHFGHNEFGFKQKINSNSTKQLDILIIPAFVTFDISSYLSKVHEKLNELSWTKVGLVSTIQHLKNLQELQTYLESMGIENIVQGEGQILGCHVENIRGFSEKVDGIISLNAGGFHTKGLILSTTSPILQLDPFTGDLAYFSSEDRKKLIQKRHIIITQAQNAKVWGVLSSSKLGQYNPNIVSRIEKILLDHNRSKITIFSDNLNFENLANFTSIDAWVDTACPRLAIDDHISLEKPILTFKEFLYLFKEVTWENILAKGFF